MAIQPLSRRSVLGGAAVAAVAGVVGYVVASNSSAADGRSAGTGANGYGPTPSRGRRLVALAQIPAAGGLIMRHDLIVVIPDDKGGAHAFSATCTHQGCTVGSVSGGTINCPCHGSRFDVTTGAVVAGPATSPLPSIPVTVQNGVVYTA